MAEGARVQVVQEENSQAVRIPAQFRLSASEVFIRRDESNGDLILTEVPNSMEDILDALHALQIPEDFLSSEERAPAQQLPSARPTL